ncbi:kinetochore Sim4 complex subunit FTA2-domain-containing protein [Bombardia bombarda]|uniref:Kinetochore Sim4 complex subunit FTA2-domain-containing protein n=1 Tax=Bombardia bombarda TaxID=252184 RepID=A0AA39XN77_9PEZI|nr:kinetochore Sim4 complex subunit FTA2-domain-containing protein [Bombardia bombarda]
MAKSNLLVFRVSIDDHIFALKIFRFYDHHDVISCDIVALNAVMPQVIINQLDPFYSECRAYGRLEETDNKHLAVQCYGYVFLDQATEAHLAERYYDRWHRTRATKGRPLRAIVKEYIDSNDREPFTPKMFPQMRRDVVALNSLGIVVWDLRADNYCAGRIIDFSQARTVPHMELDFSLKDVYSHWTQVQCCLNDYFAFDEIIDDWNDDHPNRVYYGPRFFPNRRFGFRLRNKSRYYGRKFGLEDIKVVATYYD